ncbi:hypothetical protein H9Y04_35560 [Streptomyces sp. TRM66268-LWL]|uniref:Uncharacterized protein n=1 Tax=Streptomyces polyasparticus TaxID=2767826 RepID=A0ABR7SUA8_9ACTN|nr:hypothetical protein [Streptomyces polyasparticus]MBC9717863.1 hypothetical protein [Streptomyces polyasparticus]
MNLAKDNANWQRTLSVTPLPTEVRRRASLYVASRADGHEDLRTLLDQLGLLDPALQTSE